MNMKSSNLFFFLFRSDTIIGRDLENSCFKVHFSPTEFTFEVKSIEEEKLNYFKQIIFDLFDELFNFYPGLYYLITVKS